MRKIHPKQLKRMELRRLPRQTLRMPKMQQNIQGVLPSKQTKPHNPQGKIADKPFTRA